MYQTRAGHGLRDLAPPVVRPRGDVERAFVNFIDVGGGGEITEQNNIYFGGDWPEAPPSTSCSPDASDDPDPYFFDANCDGVDGDPADSVFVSISSGLMNASCVVARKEPWGEYEQTQFRTAAAWVHGGEGWYPYTGEGRPPQGAAMANLAMCDRFEDGDVTQLIRTGDRVTIQPGEGRVIVEPGAN